jgi:hypothetical protein
LLRGQESSCVMEDTQWTKVPYLHG